MNYSNIEHNHKLAASPSLVSKDNALHISRNTKIGNFTSPDYKSFEKPTLSIHEEQITNMQQQVQLLEQENSLLTKKEQQRENLMGLELSDGQPMNEHMVQLKLKQDKLQKDQDCKIAAQKETENEQLLAVDAMTTEGDQIRENIVHLRQKLDKVKAISQNEDLQQRQQKDEIENEVDRCTKTNKQAFADLMETKAAITDLLNKKRDLGRKFEDENKKFRDVDHELTKKISELNSSIAKAKHEKNLLINDAKEGLSLRKITAHQRNLSNRISDIAGDAETGKLNSDKSQKQIDLLLSQMSDYYSEIAHLKIQIEGYDNQISSLAEEKGKEKLVEMLEVHSNCLVFRLDLEHRQDKLQADQQQEDIQGYEQESNLLRNQYVRECNDKDEIKSAQAKLDDQYKKQATEISKLKHSAQEQEIRLQELIKAERDEESQFKLLNASIQQQKFTLGQMMQEISVLKEKNQNWEKFKMIDMKEVSSVVEANNQIGSTLESFLSKFANSSFGNQYSTN